MLWIVSAVSRFRKKQGLDAEPDHNHKYVFSTRTSTPSEQDDTCRYGVTLRPDIFINLERRLLAPLQPPVHDRPSAAIAAKQALVDDIPERQQRVVL